MIAGTNRINYKKTGRNIRRIHIRRKFLLIIQIKENSYFKDIKKLEELSSLSKGYRFTEGNKSLNENQMLEKGTHLIHYRCLFKGGSNITIILIKDTKIPVCLPNNTLTEDVMKMIGGWLKTDGNLINLFGMHNNFSGEYLLDRNDILWNGRNDFKLLKVRIASQGSETLIGINRSQGLINLEVAINGITQYMILHQFITIRTFKKLIIKRFSIHNSWLTLDVYYNDETTTTLFYKKGNVQIDTRSNDNINSLKKILIKRYLLSHDIVLTDKFTKPYPEYQLIKNIQTNIYICIIHEGIIKQTSLKRTKYIINNDQNIDEFDALYYNGWNLYSLNHYMNLLTGGAKEE
jgi:hypothetical protein